MSGEDKQAGGGREGEPSPKRKCLPTPGEDIRLNLVIDKEKKKLLFAECRNDFIDYLLSDLNLPLGPPAHGVGEEEIMVMIYDDLHFHSHNGITILHILSKAGVRKNQNFIEKEVYFGLTQARKLLKAYEATADNVLTSTFLGSDVDTAAFLESDVDTAAFLESDVDAAAFLESDFD